MVFFRVILPIFALLLIFLHFLGFFVLFLLLYPLPLFIYILLFDVNLNFFERLRNSNELVIVTCRRIRMVDFRQTKIFFLALLQSGEPVALKDLKVLKVLVFIHKVLLFLFVLVVECSA